MAYDGLRLSSAMHGRDSIAAKAKEAADLAAYLGEKAPTGIVGHAELTGLYNRATSKAKANGVTLAAALGGKGASTAAKPATPGAPATVSALAHSLAIQAERNAVAKLFGHRGARDRVSQLCSGLSGGKSATALLAQLEAGTMITDQQLRGIVANAVASEAGSSWDRAIDNLWPDAKRT